MSIDDILNEQRKWLNEAAGRLAKPDRPEDILAMPLAFRKVRVGEIDARVKQLEAQKQEAIQRYDAAIAAERAEMEQLARDIDWDKGGPVPAAGTATTDVPPTTTEPKIRQRARTRPAGGSG